jgi:hypothetical protein
LGDIDEVFDRLARFWVLIHQMNAIGDDKADFSRATFLHLRVLDVLE